MKIKSVKLMVFEEIAKFIAWNFKVFESGVFPSRGYYNEKFDANSKRGKRAGDKLMGGWQMVFAGTQSDGKARREMHNFNRWWKCRDICDGCDAQNPALKNVDPTLSYCDFTARARWRETVLSHDQYMAGDNVSPFACIPGFRKELALRDFAHMDLLGYGRDLGAALTKSLHLRHELGEGLLDEQLRGLWGDLNDPENRTGRKVSGYLNAASVGMDNMYCVLYRWTSDS